MKTAGRENPNTYPWTIVSRNRVHGAEGQNRSRSFTWAAKLEKRRPSGWCFFLTSPFIELDRDMLDKLTTPPLRLKPCWRSRMAMQYVHSDIRPEFAEHIRQRIAPNRVSVL